MNLRLRHFKAQQISTLVKPNKKETASHSRCSQCSSLPIRLLHHLHLCKSLGFPLESALHSLPLSLKLSPSHSDLYPISNNHSNTFNHSSNSRQFYHRHSMYHPWIRLLKLMLSLTQRINPLRRQKYLTFSQVLHNSHHQHQQHHLRFNSTHSNSHRVAQLLLQ